MNTPQPRTNRISITPQPLTSTIEKWMVVVEIWLMCVKTNTLPPIPHESM